ncbi:baseplate J/gp47 family protein [Dickeya solani]|uniref:Baseplate J/gp47 family protein n=1 Tax=Dickeya solani TaxID=1089444 RepID=A0ABU4EE65_9GAMM|nr:baseplate J/gp47 family protein [Dickeya solani]MCA7001643.1 baseplate J/gp47 family protein [Dickeya solani]MCZ0821071.1 baseplate J/gp47 family protein [Dickeya solani]MDV6997446.1 baseplate J/gp47 family protein [Dickeya solani]MDV7003056.1 baseplate J/gp47 family protein [Dickeya solani]MDV7040252.1 baseplate J/gp47 family protein [Dickeya solani]
MSAVDLSQLSAPGVVETLDYETLLEARQAAFLALYPESERPAVAATLALESEPVVKLLQESAYREILLRQRINEAARAVMLAYAAGADLEQLAANLNVERLTITAADDTAIPAVAAVMESDADLRSRAQSAFEGLSVAGPMGAYVYHARSADGRVADATAISPSPAAVTVTVLSTEGNGTAPADLLAAVAVALNDEDVRPVGDRVTVNSAVIVSYEVVARLYVYPGPEVEPIRQAAAAKLTTYIGTQRRLGRDIRRSALYAALHVEGVQRVELDSPASDVVLDDTQAAYCAGHQVTIGGSDE